MLSPSENIVTSITINYIKNYEKYYKNIVHITLLKFYYYSIITSMFYYFYKYIYMMLM